LCSSIIPERSVAVGCSDRSGPAPGGALDASSGSASSSLEPLEIKGQALGVSIQSDAAHARYRLERLTILSALSDDPVPTSARRVAKMADCCATPAIGLTHAGAVGCVWFRCRDRLCPLCSAARSRQVAERIVTAVRDADALRFLTLTFKHTAEPLKMQLDRLYAAYRELRHTPAWKHHVYGSVAAIEIKRSEDGKSWHPHLHVLADGIYWDQAAIARLWLQITGDSPIVHIKAVPMRRKFINYMAKYAGKPAELQGWTPAWIREYAHATHRRRLLITAGNMHNKASDSDDDGADNRVTGERIPLHAVERRSVYGCKASSIVLAALASQSAAYQSSLAVRRPGTLPNLAAGQTGKLANPRVAYESLLSLWSDDPVGFVMGTSLASEFPPPPKRPKGRGRIRDNTEPIANWHQRSTRHI